MAYGTGRNWNGRFNYPIVVNQQIMESSSDEETVAQYIRRKRREAYDSEAEDSLGYSDSSSDSEDEDEEETETETEASQLNTSEENETETETTSNSESQPTGEDDDEGSGSSSSESSSSSGESVGFIEHVDMYVSCEGYTKRTFLHLKQLIPRARNCNKEDVFFPIDQADEVLDSLSELIEEELPEDEKERKSFLECGVTTSHVEVWLEYTPQYRDFYIFIRCLKNNACVSFPRKDGQFYFERMEWYRNTHIPVKYQQDNYNHFFYN